MRDIGAKFDGMAAANPGQSVAVRISELIEYARSGRSKALYLAAAAEAVIIICSVRLKVGVWQAKRLLWIRSQLIPFPAAASDAKFVQQVRLRNCDPKFRSRPGPMKNV